MAGAKRRRPRAPRAPAAASLLRVTPPRGAARRAGRPHPAQQQPQRGCPAGPFAPAPPAQPSHCRRCCKRLCHRGTSAGAHARRGGPGTRPAPPIRWAARGAHPHAAGAPAGAATWPPPLRGGCSPGPHWRLGARRWGVRERGRPLRARRPEASTGGGLVRVARAGSARPAPPATRPRRTALSPPHPTPLPRRDGRGGHRRFAAEGGDPASRPSIPSRPFWRPSRDGWSHLTIGGDAAYRVRLRGALAGPRAGGTLGGEGGAAAASARPGGGPLAPASSGRAEWMDSGIYKCTPTVWGIRAPLCPAAMGRSRDAARDPPHAPPLPADLSASDEPLGVLLATERIFQCLPPVLVDWTRPVSCLRGLRGRPWWGERWERDVQRPPAEAPCVCWIGSREAPTLHRVPPRRVTRARAAVDGGGQAWTWAAARSRPPGPLCTWSVVGGRPPPPHTCTVDGIVKGGVRWHVGICAARIDGDPPHVHL